MPTPYFTLVREMKSAYNHRLRLVAHARQHGIKPTARLFQTTVPTVRKWLRRYQQQGPRSLIELSRAPHHQPRKTPADIEQQVVALRQQLFTFGARRLIREFDLPLSHRALERIWRAHGLLQKRQRKYQRKQDLAHIKATWRVFQQISADTKDLDDIPRYGLRPRPSISPQSSTPLARCAAACCSGPLPSAAPRPPAPSLPLAFSSISSAAASLSATWSGRPTTAPSSSAVMIAVVTPPASPPL